MFTSIRKVDDFSFVDGSITCYQVSVMVNPQVPPIDVIFKDLDRAVDFIRLLNLGSEQSVKLLRSLTSQNS